MVRLENTAVLIFPHHLFLEHPALNMDADIFIIEDQIFFSDPEFNIHFHKKKLLLHRASMKYYMENLQKRRYTVTYVDYEKDLDMCYIFNLLEKEEINKIFSSEIIDYTLKKRIKKQCQKRNMKMVELEGPGFLTSKKQIKEYLLPKKRVLNKSMQNKSQADHYLMNSFYIKQRKYFNILIEDGKPSGGKWSYDKSNRKKIPQNTHIPSVLNLKHKDEIYLEACRYVEKNFPHHPGDLNGFNYPLNHKQAENWLKDFIENRLSLFGDYEDAIKKQDPFLFHSIISSSMNIGLITPSQVLKEIDKAEAPLNSKEGFIRQIIGWREFMRAIYYRESHKQRTTNYMEHQVRMNEKLYNGHTGLPPYDKVVERVHRHAYAHHIERLMIIGNLMFLLGIHPDDIYRWFMEMFIDSYDWVMVPNVYGMSQYADGGLITTKPYLSSSNYIKRMSDFKGGGWDEIWDALFWVFIEKNKELMRRNPRTAMLLGNLKNKEKMEKHRETASIFIKSLKLLKGIN